MGAGRTTLVAPTETVEGDRETLDVEGVQIEFVQAANTEAPSEFILWFPELKVLNLAELAVHTMHNLLTPRGAVVRDAVAWWKALHSAVREYGGRAEILVGQHHWPTWGVEEVREYLAAQRDVYKFLHDESLRRMNHGETMQELAEEIQLPPALASLWHTQGYYGSLNHNTKAVYQHYLGWWDGNPLTYHQHPPAQTGERLIRMLGGIEAALDSLDVFFEEGDYRWVAQVCAWVLFAQPDSARARELGAAALDQMAIQTMNASWRNIFLTGAQELRAANPRHVMDRGIDGPTAQSMTDEQLLDYAGICFNGETGQDLAVSFTWHQPDDDASYLVEARHGVLIYSPATEGEAGAAVVSANRAAFARLLGTPQTEESLQETAQVSGDAAAVLELLSHVDHFPRFFPVTLP
jgi:alkyl sulfatase BDS1-like metallo-beta-lactamase superfamily hydrolase